MFSRLAVSLSLSSCLLGLAGGAQSASAQTNSVSAAPTIDRVEPPNWWTGSTVNPVRVLMHGYNLDGARVYGATGLTVSNVKVSESGDYVFADVSIDKNAAAGMRSLKVTTGSGAAGAPFEVDKPLPPDGRFQGWSPDDVVYLIMPDRFADGDLSNDDPAVSKGEYDRSNPHLYHGGDFQGIIDHLPYLKDLGVTAIWINPIYDNYDTPYPNHQADYHGYGAVNQYGVEEHLGTMAKLREMVDKAHAVGIKVIQDQVANHVGQMHPWNTEGTPTPTWFNGTKQTHGVNIYQIWTIIDPHTTSVEQANTLGGWFVDTLPDLNQNDPEVARYEIQNAIWWVGETGFDGIREDTMPYVPRDFWTKWNMAITKEFPKVNAVGEVNNGDVGIVSYFQGGRTLAGVDTKMYSLFDYPMFYPARRVFAQGSSFEDLVSEEAHDWLYPDPNVLLTFLGNHDVNRFMDEQGATAKGLELADTFLLTSRGVPLLYYGDEIGLPGGNDPDNRRDFPGGFPGDSQNAFTAAGRTPQQEEIWEHLRKLNHLHAELAPLRGGSQINLYQTEKQWAYARILNGEVVVVALNNDHSPATFTVPVTAAGLHDGATLTDRLGDAAAINVAQGKVSITLPARSGAVYK